MKSLQKILVPNLHNFVSGTTIPSTITKKILNCYYAEKSNMEFLYWTFSRPVKKSLWHGTGNCFPKASKIFKKMFLTSNIPSNELSVKKGTEAQKLKILQNWICNIKKIELILQEV